MKKTSITKFLINFIERRRENILFSIFGFLNAFITFIFYYNDLIGLSAPLFSFLILSFFIGKKKRFLLLIENNLIIFFLSWLFLLTILVNL